MTNLETRSVSRDSLFLLANIRVEQQGETHRVRVRNLSDGGMMGEGSMRVQRGNRLEIELRNIGVVHGSVAWVQDNRFGIAFDDEIDSQLARRPLDVASDNDASTIERSWAHKAPKPPSQESVRKI